jgi:hypothetical protein
MDTADRIDVCPKRRKYLFSLHGPRDTMSDYSNMYNGVGKYEALPGHVTWPMADVPPPKWGEPSHTKVEIDTPLGPITGKIVHDPVLKPAHYARWKMEPIEFISVNDFPFWLANVIKYACRYDAKDGLQDLYKARAYLDIQIRKLEGHDNFWAQPVATQQALERNR